MTLDDFWSIIDRSAEVGGGDDGRQREALRDLLTELADSDLVDFSTHFHALMVRADDWDLANAAYLIDDALGDDGFYDLRDYLIARGRTTYEMILEDPQALLDHPLDYGEMYFWNTIDEAYRIRHGLDPEESDADLGLSFEWPERAGEKIDDHDDAEIRRRYPRIWRKLRLEQEEP